MAVCIASSSILVQMKAQEVWSTWTSPPRTSRAVYTHSFTLVALGTIVYDGNDVIFTDNRRKQTIYTRLALESSIAASYP